MENKVFYFIYFIISPVLSPFPLPQPTEMSAKIGVGCRNHISEDMTQPIMKNMFFHKIGSSTQLYNAISP
jgi:hypothetical protein